MWQGRRKQWRERAEAACLGERRAVGLVSGKLRDGLYGVVGCVALGVEQRDEAGQSAHRKDHLAHVATAGHARNGPCCRAFGEAIG